MARLRFSCVGRCNRLFVVAPLVVVCALAVYDFPEMFVRRARVASRVSRFRTCSLRARRVPCAFTCGFRVLNVRIRLNRCRVRVFGLTVMGVRLASLMAQRKRSLVSFPPKNKKRGCRRLVIIHGRDGAATVFRERFRTHKNHDGGWWRCVMRIVCDNGDGDDCGS